MLGRDERTQIIDAMLQRLNDSYIFPEVAQAIERSVRQRLATGDYLGLESDEAFCSALTDHLQEVSHDKHLRVRYHEQVIPERKGAAPSPETLERARQETLKRNAGFRQVQRLDGNIGYLELRQVASPDLAGEIAVAAMNFLAHTDGLIVDLRQNGGGHPGTVALLCTYLLGSGVHLNSFYRRAGDKTDQFWTLPYVPGRLYPIDKPVYVLTSSRTFSAAEEFTYNLKTQKRATIVGEVTGGGAHPGSSQRLHDHVEIFIPTGRAINPITGTNWEGTGVEPDLAVPAEQALDHAYAVALRHVIARAEAEEAGPLKAILPEAREALASVESRLA